MKTLLIRPPFAIEKFYFPAFINEPLGLEYLFSFIRNSHEVKIIDAIGENWNKYWKLNEYPETIFQGLTPEKIIKKLSKYNPEIVGLNWFFSTQTSSVNLVAKAIKQFNNKIKIVVGGAEPSANPRKILETCEYIDIVVCGEGEETLKEILDNSAENLEGIKGIVFRKNNKIIINPARELIESLDNLPLPSREVMPYGNYSKQHAYKTVYLKISKLKLKEKTKLWISSKIASLPFIDKIYYKLYNTKNRTKFLPSADIVTSRGCPNHCTFCAIHNIWGHRWRMRSAENVLEEIDILIKKYKVKHINIQDDNFSVSKERILKICKEIVNRKYNITLSTPSGVYIPSLDEEVLTWLKKAGLNMVRMSVESGDSHILHDIIKKNIDLTKVKDIVDTCRKIGIETEGAFIFGIPGETIETMQNSLNFATKTGFDRIVKFIFQPFPNTELYDLCIKNGYLTDSYNSKQLYVTGNKCFVKTNEFSPDDVLKIVNRQYRV